MREPVKIEVDVDLDVLGGLAIVSLGAGDQKLAVAVTPDGALQMAQLLIERAVNLDPDAPARVQRAAEAQARLHAGHNEVVKAARESILAQQDRLARLRKSGPVRGEIGIGN